MGKLSDTELAEALEGAKARLDRVKREYTALYVETLKRLQAACGHDWSYLYDSEAPHSQKACRECSKCYLREFT